MMTPAELHQSADELGSMAALIRGNAPEGIHSQAYYARADRIDDLARKLRAEADAWESCEYCHGEGEVFGHAEDCRDDLCALNGDMHSCVGRLLPCNCRPLPPGPEA